jgi:hypothetical protein
MIDDILNINSKIYKSEKSFQSIFQKISENIMNNYTLSIKGNSYQLCEIEFYLETNGHNDPFIHGDIDQNFPGRWYFHKQNGKSYKSGTYKGLDITFGNDDKTTYGGILIRSIKKLATDEIIEGPCKVVNKILEIYGELDVKSFLQALLKLDKETDSNTVEVKKIDKMGLYIDFNDDNGNDNDNVICQVYGSSRVGLTLKKYTNEMEGYLTNPYRFINHLSHVQKYNSIGII